MDPLFSDLFVNRHQQVVVNCEESDPAPVISGVPLGSVIGPLLFLILIGDIDQEVAHSFISPMVITAENVVCDDVFL